MTFLLGNDMAIRATHSALNKAGVTQRLTGGIKGGRLVKCGIDLPRDTGHLGGGASSGQSQSERNG